jgi:hypothetical protein
VPSKYATYITLFFENLLTSNIIDYEIVPQAVSLREKMGIGND